MVVLDYETMLKTPSFSLERKEKTQVMTERLNVLTKHHYNNCEDYRKILDAMNYDVNKTIQYDDIPFLPVRIFKEKNLKSVSDDSVVKIMTSSGTTGQNVSKIYLDKTTASNQQKIMVKIVSDFIVSNHRMPMIVIDTQSVLKDRKSFSARGAGILGFSIFASDKIFALNDDMSLDVDGVRSFLKKHEGQRILLFGFTFMIWKHFYRELERLSGEGIKFDLSNGIMIHGGGWKKLIDESVSTSEFNRRIGEVTGLKRIHNYYGMVEQTGCIYMECEHGHLHTSIFSDIITRRPLDFSKCNYGEEGIIQVISTIPESYPGHSLLTEDRGTIIGEDDCPCGRKGKYFSISGRISKAEIRGCSDTYATRFA